MDKETIEKLFRQHYAQMTRLARTLLYDDEEARDVASEVFATLMKADIPPKNMEGYLMASVRNRCLNLIAHKSVREKFKQAYTIAVQSSECTVHSAECTEQRLQEVMAFARQNLTEQTLRVFRMRHLQGMKYQEIADELGISRVMVYKHLTKAMEIIKAYQRKTK